MDDLGPILLKLARGAIAERLGLPAPAPRSGEARRPELALPGATFVTLTRDGELRGCIGTLKARRALGDDVRVQACAAAFDDPRFPPLTADEFPAVRVEVSVLGEPRELPVESEADALRKLRPGIDGVILARDGKRATFLPQVWAELPDPGEFLAQLKLKAGLPANFWDARIALQTYPVEKFSEPPA